MKVIDRCGGCSHAEDDDLHAFASGADGDDQWRL